jgi:DNA-binding MarR family transcriptional regulator
VQEQSASAHPGLTDLVGSALISVAREHRVLVARGLADLGLYPGQEILLAQLWACDDLSQSELTTRLGVEPPTVVKAVHRMEAGGFVTRNRDPADGRVSRIRLTPTGRALRKPVEQIWADAEELMLAGLDAADRAAAKRILGVCYDNLHEGRGGGD